MVRNTEITNKMKKYFPVFKAEAKEADNELVVRKTW